MTSLSIAIAGGIGSGKSSIAALLREKAVPVLDLDHVAKVQTAIGSPVLQALQACYGDAVLHADGSLNRDLLAKQCFSSEQETQRLNALLHPLIWRAAQAWLQQQTSAYACIEASALFESGLWTRFDGILVVCADRSLRLQRVLARGRQDQEMFDKIVAQQWNDAQRCAHADWVINNTADLAELKLKVGHLQQQFHTWAASCQSSGGSRC